MQSAAHAFTAEERDQVRRAVEQAESNTSAEIVPVVATASGRYDRAEDIVGLWVGVVAMGAGWALWPSSPRESGAWSEFPPWIDFARMVGLLLAGFLAGAWLASRVGWLRHLFTPRAMLRAEVSAKARQLFFDQRVHHTRDRSGLLIYVSLFERQAVILADAEVIARVGQPVIDGLCEQLTRQLAVARPATALCETILAAGDALPTALPRRSDDTQELADKLVILG